MLPLGKHEKKNICPRLAFLKLALRCHWSFPAQFCMPLKNSPQILSVYFIHALKACILFNIYLPLTVLGFHSLIVFFFVNLQYFGGCCSKFLAPNVLSQDLKDGTMGMVLLPHLVCSSYLCHYIGLSICKEAPIHGTVCKLRGQ